MLEVGTGALTNGGLSPELFARDTKVAGFHIALITMRFVGRIVWNVGDFSTSDRPWSNHHALTDTCVQISVVTELEFWRLINTQTGNGS